MIREFDVETGSYQTAPSANESVLFTDNLESGECARGWADSLSSWQRRERPILQIANSRIHISFCFGRAILSPMRSPVPEVFQLTV